MKCLYCDNEINNYSLYSLLVEEDKLCTICRDKMKFKHTIINKDGISIETFYEYDSLFRDILLQYKECYDEALKDVFLYKIEDYIKLKYHGYKIIYAPSTKEKVSQRGFNHLELIFEKLNMEKVEGIKIKEEITQQNRNKKERQKIIDNFYYEGPYLDKVLIVDDVYTTGSTICGLTKALQRYCKKIKVIVLSR